jgi:hypothetical protein
VVSWCGSRLVRGLGGGGWVLLWGCGLLAQCGGVVGRQCDVAGE